MERGTGGGRGRNFCPHDRNFILVAQERVREKDGEREKKKGRGGEEEKEERRRKGEDRKVHMSLCLSSQWVFFPSRERERREK